MNFEPTNLEVFLTKLIFRFFGKVVYKEYADRLPLSGNESVLDFGCGMGTVAYYVSKRLTTGDLTCTDVSAKWLEVCQKTLRGCRDISFMLGDIYKLPLQKKNFDLIYCHLVLHDISECELVMVIPALSELLKPNGLLVFREPLDEANKLRSIHDLIVQNGFSKKDSRITDAPLMDTTLENIYMKY